jgi:TRAP-type C4-dicarboxylate transport system substrate-binding protein
MKTKILSSALALAALLSFSLASNAQDSKWERNHPRRDQVNDRLANQRERINEKTEDGQMSKREAAKLHAEDRGIRAEERNMAARDGGHITKADQRRLNRQENRVSRQIRRH